MSYFSDPPPPSDVCLMLRAHAEQRWLSQEIVPVLRQLRDLDELPEEQLGAALAYLEVTWLEAVRLAAETDAAFADLDHACPASPEETLPSKARSYHAAVLTLREAIALHVSALVAAPRDGASRTHELMATDSFHPAVSGRPESPAPRS
jgi:hypothetical protein